MTIRFRIRAGLRFFVSLGSQERVCNPSKQGRRVGEEAVPSVKSRLQFPG